ncbi:MAG TPA: ArsA-related P-loop ATPase, partial [Steroidobacteraceae bacterium]|nr:ArsA-related P-loop ATPase [Steroidobacteraceae bacterium]
MKPAHALELRDHRLLICLGPGGVGKTTLSAALALNAAIAGRTVDVMTVDPAPRLLDALGLAAGDLAIQTVPLAGLGAPRGARLRALKLDPKRTFDSLIERHAPSAAARDAILANRIYRNLSSALAGVANYMAIEKLIELNADTSTGLIVLDTPPALQAIDFLDAPRRLLELLGSRAITLLGAGRSALRGRLSMIDLAARAVLNAFDRLTGLHLLGDVQGFVANFDGMYAGFADRAAQAQALIRNDDTLVVLVTTAEAERVDQAIEFIAALTELGLKLGAVAVNRVMAPLPGPSAIAAAGLPAALGRKLQRNLDDYGALRQREAHALERLRT